MRIFARYAICTGSTAALLAGCGGGGQHAMPSAAAPAKALTQGVTFSYTGTEQSFVVPRGVTQITVVARGAGGASCPRTGREARVYAVIPVTPKEPLHIYVGGTPTGSGGGGYFGGGGGGGGSSYVEPSATYVRYWGNWKNASGNGQVVFSW